VFYDQFRVSEGINDQDIHPLAIDGPVRRALRLQNFSEADLSENALPTTPVLDFIFQQPEHPELRFVHKLLFFVTTPHDNPKLFCGIVRLRLIFMRFIRIISISILPMPLPFPFKPKITSFVINKNTNSKLN